MPGFVVCTEKRVIADVAVLEVRGSCGCSVHCDTGKFKHFRKSGPATAAFGFFRQTNTKCCVTEVAHGLLVYRATLLL